MHCVSKMLLVPALHSCNRSFKNRPHIYHKLNSLDNKTVSNTELKTNDNRPIMKNVKNHPGTGRYKFSRRRCTVNFEFISYAKRSSTKYIKTLGYPSPCIRPLQRAVDILMTFE